MKNLARILIAAAFLATIPAANWLIGHVGTCLPDGPCVIPVAPGLMAPSGVLMIGAALVLRAMLQMAADRAWIVGAIIAGVMLSAAVAPPSLVLASAAAFGLSELADWSVYSPLAARNLRLAVFCAGLIGSAVDSAVFLQLAFGSLDFMAGQIVGKLWATVAVMPVLPWMRHAVAPSHR
jgi:queuosine precursor transporter